MWFPRHPQRQQCLGVLPTQTMLLTSKGRPAGGVTSWAWPRGELGSAEGGGTEGQEDVLKHEKPTRDSAGAAPWGTAQERGCVFNAAFCQGRGDAKSSLLPARPHRGRNHIYSERMPSSGKCHLENITGLPGQTSQDSTKPGAKQLLKFLSNGSLRGNSFQGKPRSKCFFSLLKPGESCTADQTHLRVTK